MGSELLTFTRTGNVDDDIRQACVGQYTNSKFVVVASEVGTAFESFYNGSMVVTHHVTLAIRLARGRRVQAVVGFVHDVNETTGECMVTWMSEDVRPSTICRVSPAIFDKLSPAKTSAARKWREAVARY